MSKLPGQIERTWKRSLVCTDMCKMSLEHAPGAKPLMCIALYCTNWFHKWKFPGLWNPDSKIDTDHAELSHNDLLFLISWMRKSSVERSLEHLKWTTNAMCTKCCLASNDNIYFRRLINGEAHHKIPKISPGASIFQRPFLRGLFLEGLIYRGKFVFQNRLG